MAVTAVMMDPARAPGEKLDPETRAEIEYLSPDLETGQVGENELAAQAVSREKIKLGAVATAQIAQNGVEAANMAANSVPNAALQTGSVTGDKTGIGVPDVRDAAGNLITSHTVVLTAAQYAQITTPDPNTDYIVVG